METNLKNLTLNELKALVRVHTMMIISNMEDLKTLDEKVEYLQGEIQQIVRQSLIAHEAHNILKYLFNEANNN